MDYSTEAGMEQYLICDRRGNRPRIHVKICEHRCQHTDHCPAYKAYRKTQVADKGSSVSGRTEIITGDIPSPLAL